jgi:exosortase
MASLANPAPDQPSIETKRPFPWIALTWFFGLLVLAFFPILQHLVNQWATDEDVGHGFFVPAIAAYIAWQRRDELLAVESKPARWGWAILAWGALQAYLGTVGAELFLQRTAFLITLVGVLLVLGGTALVRALAFPLLLLPFMIPIPTVVYNAITFPLQLLASRIAEVVLSWIDIPVFRDGNVLELANQRLSVAEACSGIRSLLSLTFLSLVYAYFFDSKVWMRWVLLIATVPIAILANSARVTITGILSQRDPELTKGLFHSLEGWIIFVIDLAMLFALHKLINMFAERRMRAAPEPAKEPVDA